MDVSGAGLLNERLVTAQPSLIRAVGLQTAVVVQQVHYHALYADGTQEHEGEQWWPVTISAFAEELGLSTDQMRRTIEKAEAEGLLVSCQPEGRASRRKWYRVDRQAVEARVGESASSMRANLPDGNRANPPLPMRANPPVPPLSDVEEPKAESEPKGSKPRARFLEFDALVEAFGKPGTREEEAFYAKTARSLKAQGKTPAEISDRGKRARSRHAECTVNVLLTRWSNFAPRGPAAGGTIDDLAARDAQARS